MSEWSAERRCSRHPIRVPVIYKLKDPAHVKAGMGWTRDLSEEGAYLELTERLEPSSTLVLFIGTEKRGLEVEATVVWVGGQGSAGEGILHGVSFPRVSAEQRQALSNLLNLKGQRQLAGLRLPLEISVLCRPKGKEGPPLQGRTADISREGLLLLLSQVVPAGSVLHVTLSTARGKVEAEGVIAWVEAQAGQAAAGLVPHGLRFTDINWSNQMTLGLLLAEMP